MRAEMGKHPSRAPASQLQLPPGFRFYPTDEELVVHYLCKKAASEPFSIPIIAEIELYKFDPWDLPDMALFGEKEWYFFSPRDRKYPNGSRPNRAAGSGYWKATGTDKPINTLGGSKKVGVKKALVFYKGKAPKGVKTNWIMHEYRLADGAARSAKRKGSLRLDDWVLCRIYKKSASGQKTAKERNESSCAEDVLASLPEIDDSSLRSIPRLNVMEGLPSAIDLHQETEHSGGSGVTMLQSEATTGRESIGNLGSRQSPSRAYEESSQEGGSSPEPSHPSNELSTPPHSMEDDSVESTFNLLPSFPTNQFTGEFNQPFFSFDGLPNPFGRLETFAASLGEFDYYNFPSDYPFQRSGS